MVNGIQSSLFIKLIHFYNAVRANNLIILRRPLLFSHSLRHIRFGDVDNNVAEPKITLIYEGHLCIHIKYAH